MLSWRMVTMCTAVLVLSVVTATAAYATTPPRGTVRIRGIDVSSYQHIGRTINWQAVARSGIKFAAVKVSEGTYYTNPYYAGDARAAAGAGLAVMPYVFANPHASPGAATARFAIRAARYTGGGARSAAARLPLMVDLESDPYAPGDGTTGACYGMKARQIIAWIAGFATQTVALTGKAPIIYTSALWWRRCTGNTALFKRDPLWIASYDTSSPALPSPWNTWTFWQYTDDAVLPGVGLTDVDFYQATSALPALGDPADTRPATKPPAKKAAPKKAAPKKAAATKAPASKARRPAAPA